MYAELYDLQPEKKWGVSVGNSGRPVSYTHLDVYKRQALRYIAKAADGSMRDALSLLDQCIAFYLGQKVTYEHVLEVLGAVDTDVFSRLLRKVINTDVPGVLDVVEELVMQGRDLTQLTADFTWYLRNLLLVKTSDNIEDVLDVSTENMMQLKEESGMIETAALFLSLIHI